MHKSYLIYLDCGIACHMYISQNPESLDKNSHLYEYAWAVNAHTTLSIEVEDRCSKSMCCIRLWRLYA